MYQLIEMWSAKPSWGDLPREDREALINGILAKVGPMMEKGLTVSAAGLSASSLPMASEHSYFAVWNAPNEDMIQDFLKVVSDGGFFEHFDQVNIGGQAIELGDLLQGTIERGH